MRAWSNLVIIPCPDGSDSCQKTVGVLTAFWSLSKDGEVVASGRAEPSLPYYTQGLGGIGGFHTDRGSYILNVEILKDENRISTEQPYLVVYETGGAYFKAGDRLASGFMTFLLFGPIGICALVISGTIHRQESEALIRRFPLTLPGPLPGEPLARPQRAVLRRPRYPALRRRPSQPRRPGLSTAVLITAITFQLTFIVMCVLQSWAWVLPRGFLVRLIRPDVYAQPSAGIQPLVVRVAPGPDNRPIPFVDEQAISWNNLAPAVAKELSQRPPDWPVYLEADPNLEWQAALEAVDIIRGLPAQVVLLPHRPHP